MIQLIDALAIPFGRRSARCLVPAVLAALLAVPAAAQTMYVTDILRLGLHDSSDTSDQPFRMLASGDELEVLERTRYYARVRTRDGAQGWVKASYLIDEKPAQARLAELTADRDRLATELADLRSRLSRYDNEVESLRSERIALEDNVRTTAAELTTLRTDNEALTGKVSAYRFSIRLRWVLLIGVLTLVGGFLGGWWYADAKQRARHGGFRI